MGGLYFIEEDICSILTSDRVVNQPKTPE